MSSTPPFSFFFFFHDTAPTELYTLSLHDALPISSISAGDLPSSRAETSMRSSPWSKRSEEHTSELQSRVELVFRLLLEKKKDASFCSPPPSSLKSTTKSASLAHSL